MSTQGRPERRLMGEVLMGHDENARAATASPLSALAETVLADLSLGSELSTDGVASAGDGPVRHVLLTGATGFLGAFLLRELLDCTQADVWCLVRADDEERGRERIAETMKRYLVWDEALSPRIRPVIGDLAKPALGLSPEQWDRLAEQIDLIHHNGAWVSHVAPYGRLRDANVLGTLEILRLACTTRIKPVHFVSTAGIPLGYTDPAAAVLDFDGEFPGYVVGKWVAERLVQQAAERGLPTRVYRPGRISGHSVTGACQSSDMVWNFVRAVALLGLAPETAVSGDCVPEVSFSPVDYVAGAIVRMSLADKGKKADPEAVHFLVNQSRMPVHDLIGYLSLRFPLKVVPLQEWAGAVARGMEAHGSAMAAPRLLLPFFRRFLAGEASPIRVDDQTTVDELAGTGISCPPINHRLLMTYLDFFEDIGFLPTA